MTVYASQRPAWIQYRPGDMVDPYDVPDEIIDNWTETAAGGVGFNARRNCFCWGYRPRLQPRTLDGVRWSNQVTAWRICPDKCTCPTPPPCPSCPTCPVCPEIPVLEPTTCPPPLQAIDSRSKNWLWFAGAAVLVFGTYGVRRTMQLKKR